MKRDNVVCPSNLRHGLFTVGVGQSDDNQSSTNAEGSFHGIAMVLLQCPTKKNNMGQKRIPVIFPSGNNYILQSVIT